MATSSRMLKFADNDSNTRSNDDGETNNNAKDVKKIGTKYYSLGNTYTLLDKIEDVKIFVTEKLQKSDIFAFDCESVDLDRYHPVSVINTSFEDGSIFLIDVKSIGGIPSCLKSVLEDEKIIKLMFDCRSDCDSVFHQHGIKVDGIEDMQIIRYIVENPFTASGGKLSGFQWCVGNYLGIAKKRKMQDVSFSDYSGWGRRPLKKNLLEYASYEISLFFQLRRKMICSKSVEEIRRISNRYADKRRDAKSYTNGRHNAYMPYGVL